MDKNYCIFRCYSKNIVFCFQALKGPPEWHDSYFFAFKSLNFYLQILHINWKKPRISGFSLLQVKWIFSKGNPVFFIVGRVSFFGSDIYFLLEETVFLKWGTSFFWEGTGNFKYLKKYIYMYYDACLGYTSTLPPKVNVRAHFSDTPFLINNPRKLKLIDKMPRQIVVFLYSK